MKILYTLIILSFLSASLTGKTTDNRNLTKENLWQNKLSKSPEQHKAFRNGLEMSLGKTILNKTKANQKSKREIVKALDELIYEYNSGGTWNFEDKGTFSYDENGNNTLQENYFWDEAWLIYDKSEQEFDGNGNILVETYYEWDESKGLLWLPYNKYEYGYNNDGDLTTGLNSYYDSAEDSWINDSREEYGYNANGYLELITYYSWDGVSETWNVSWKNEYAYDNEGNLITVTVYSWSDTWNPLWKDDLTYDNNKNITEDLNSSWDDDANDWVNGWKDEFNYNAEGNMDINISSGWDGSHWVNLFKNELSYNNAYDAQDLIMPFWWETDDYITYVHMPTGYIGYEWIDGSDVWELSLKATLNYVDHDVTGIFNPTASEIQVYPNPATDYISFDLKDNASEATVELFDIQGRLVLSQAVSGQTKIQVNHLNKGLYMYKLLQNDNSFSGKVIVE